MRKVVSSMIAAISLSVLVSCHKSNTPASGPGGYWTLGSNTYQAASCLADSTGFTLSAYNTVTGATYSNIVFYFYNALPDTGGSYTVVQQGQLSAPGQVSVSMAYQTSSVTTYYASLIYSDSLTQKIKVTTSNGKIGLSGSGIYMVSTGIPFDTTTISFNLIQTK